jgi:hypothetical protein
MKAKLMLIVCIFLCLEGYSQESTLMRGKGYAGYSFNKSHGVFMSIENQQERYTPTKEDIVLAEKILKDSIKNVLGRQKNFSTSINLNKLKKYKRQYIGFIAKNGDVVIWINFLRDKKIEDVELSRDIIIVLDGGERYWSIFINLTRPALYGVCINGVS